MSIRRAVFGLSLATFACAALLATSVHAAQTWRLASKMPPDSPEGIVFQHFADKVNEYSNGELSVTVYPNEQLGKEAAVLEQLKLGTVHLYAEGSVFMQKWVDPIRWTVAPFVFKDREHWVRFMKHPFVQAWYKEAEEQAGIGMLGDATAILRGPYRVILTKEPLGGPEDVGAIKLRMANDKTGVEVWQHLGAEVRVLGWAETYESIQRGIVDAVTSPIALVESMKFYEVAPHITRTDEYWQSIAFMMNQRAFDRLAPELQEALLKAHGDAAAYSLELMGEVAHESIETMTSKGAVYSEVDLQPFVDAMQSYYEAKEQSGELPQGFMDVVRETAEAS
jgi:TRAP-type transport system periplasmic protein